MENVNHIFSTDRPIAGIVPPIGINLYIFQVIGYVIDVYKELESLSKNFFDVLMEI